MTCKMKSKRLLYALSFASNPFCIGKQQQRRQWRCAEKEESSGRHPLKNVPSFVCVCVLLNVADGERPACSRAAWLSIMQCTDVDGNSSSSSRVGKGKKYLRPRLDKSRWRKIEPERGEDLFKASVTRGWSEQQNIGRRTPRRRPATKAIHRLRRHTARGRGSNWF